MAHKHLLDNIVNQHMYANDFFTLSSIMDASLDEP